MDRGLAGKLTTHPATANAASPDPTTRRTTSAIQALPPEVVAQIKSSTTITTLTTAAISLLKNSLDAAATKISIEVDFSRGNLTLEDDGLGIAPTEFGETGGLGKLYHTSRYSHSSSPATTTYGANGTFLASLGALCLLTVTSKHVKHFSTNSLIMHHSAVKARMVPAPAAHYLDGAQGTRVVVRDLFGNMAVRVKQRALLAEDAGEMEKLWEELRGAITAVLIAYGRPVAVKLRNTSTGKTFRWTPPASTSGVLRSKHQLAISLLTQSHRLQAGTAVSESWIPASASSRNITIKGVISLIPSPMKAIQYLSLSIHPLQRSLHPALYEHINRLFSHSHFGTLPEDDLSAEEIEKRAKDGRFKNDGGLTRRQMVSEKGVDRWPMFVLWIELRDSARGERVLETEATLQKIVRVLDALVLKWLEAHHFKTPPAQAKGASTDAGSAETRGVSHGGRSTPRPYSGVPSINALSRVKSSHNAPSAKKTRPESAPTSDASATLKRPAPIEIETFTSQWPERRDKQVKTSDAVSTGHEEVQGCAAGVEDEVMTWTDPITKTTHLLNARTGMCMPSLPSHGPQTQPRQDGPYTSLPARTVQRKSTSQPQTEWLDSMLAKWDNPIFCTTEKRITQSSFSIPLGGSSSTRTSTREIEQAFGEVSHLTAQKISKSALRGAKVIAQVDEKFILITVAKSSSEEAGEEEGQRRAGELLVVIDQHAADERVKFEILLRELCMPPERNDDDDPRSGIKTCRLDRPTRFMVSQHERELLTVHAPHFAKWGILYDLSTSKARGDGEGGHREEEGEGDALVEVRSLPPLIVERCQAEPKLVIALLRREIHALPQQSKSTSTSTATSTGTSTSTSQEPSAPTTTNTDPAESWVKHIATCPQEMLSMAKSRACRSAIMFNDPLTTQECEVLVRELGRCVFPFVCAHGRPSLVPLIEVDASSLLTGEGDGEGEEYADAFGRWKEMVGREGECA